MSLVDVTSLQARFCSSALEKSLTLTEVGSGAWDSVLDFRQSVVTSMFSSESRFSVSSGGAEAGGSASSCLLAGDSCCCASSPFSMFVSSTVTLEVVTWEPPLGLRRGLDHLRLRGSMSISVSLLSGCSGTWAFFNTFLFFSFLTRFPLVRSEGGAGRLKTEGTGRGSGNFEAVQSATLSNSELSLLEERGFRGLQSDIGIRQLPAVWLAFSVDSTSPDKLCLQSPGSSNFSQLWSVWVW